MMNKQSIQRQTNKDFFWNLVGAYCRRCKYDECVSALQLHHLDVNEKNGKLDTLGYWLSMQRGAMLERLVATRFTILCSNCHIKLHSILRTGKTIRLNPIDTNVFLGMDLFKRAVRKLDRKITAIKKETESHILCRTEREKAGYPCKKQTCSRCKFEDPEDAIDEAIICSDKAYLESIGAA